jgi:hypothetical protein
MVCQFAANHHGVRTSPLVAWKRTLAPPRLAAPPPPAGAGEAARVKSSRPDGHPPQHQRTSPLLHPAFTPPPLLGSTALGQACCRSSPPAPPPPPPPQRLHAGRAGWRGHIIFLAAVLSPTLHPPGPVSSAMARAPTRSQPFRGKIF